MLVKGTVHPKMKMLSSCSKPMHFFLLLNSKDIYIYIFFFNLFI